MKFSFTPIVITILTTNPLSIHARRICEQRNDEWPINIVAATADNTKQLTPAFEAFRGLLGGENNGNTPEAKPTGHRQINWDADVVPFKMPGDFFANTVPRGLVITTSDQYDNEFLVSNPPPSSGFHDDKFNSVVGDDLAKQFTTFSEKRLFSPLNDNEIFINFVDPGNTHKKARVTGYGAVFTDVDSGRSVKMEFLDYQGCKLAEVVVPPQPSGLSFLGVNFGTAAVVDQVKIRLGDVAIGSAQSSVRGRRLDVVVMDDFLYGEPQPFD